MARENVVSHLLKANCQMFYSSLASAEAQGNVVRAIGIQRLTLYFGPSPARKNLSYEYETWHGLLRPGNQLI